jgi:hypothetical protein
MIPTTNLSLVKRTPLLPGESWPSLWLRLAALNHYQPPGILPAFARGRLEERGIADLLDAPRHPETYRLLAGLAGLEPGDLHAATFHHYAPLFTPPGVEVPVVVLEGEAGAPLLAGPALRSGHLLPRSLTRYCPRCLDEEPPYHRLDWLVAAVTVCLRHRCLLAQTCPSCQKPVVIRETLAARCEHCQADLRRGVTLDVSEDDLGLACQRALQTWLAGERAAQTPPASPQALYHLVYDLQGILRGRALGGYFHRVEGGRSGRQISQKLSMSRLRVSDLYALFATAIKAVMSWPEGFYGFLDAYRARKRGEDEGRNGLLADLGDLYPLLERRWRDPAFAFVQEAFDAYFASHYDRQFHARQSPRYRERPKLASGFAFLTYVEAARLLGVAPGLLTPLAWSGMLHRYRCADSTRLLFSRAEVEAVAAACAPEDLAAAVSRLHFDDLPKSRQSAPKSVRRTEPLDEW